MVSERQRILLFRQRDLLALKSFLIAFAVTALLNGLPLLTSDPRVLADLTLAEPVLGRLGFHFSLAYVFLLSSPASRCSRSRAPRATGSPGSAACSTSSTAAS